MGGGEHPDEQRGKTSYSQNAIQQGIANITWPLQRIHTFITGNHLAKLSKQQQLQQPRTNQVHSEDRQGQGHHQQQQQRHQKQMPVEAMTKC